jgi:poly(A) polymerase
MPLGGTDVLALGVPAGPRVGVILKRFEDWWIGQDFPGDFATLRAKLVELTKQG